MGNYTRRKINKIKIITAYNTDNKGHLFVTVFELPAFYIMTLLSLNADTAPVLTLKLFVS